MPVTSTLKLSEIALKTSFFYREYEKNSKKIKKKEKDDVIFKEKQS